MRSLILIFLFCSPTVASEKFSLTYNYRSSQSESQLENTPNGVFHSQTLGYQNENILPGLSVSGSLVTQQPDYSKNTILNDQGVSENIRTDLTSEYIADAQMDFTRGNNDISFGGFSFLSDSPYSQRGIRASYKYNLYGKTSILGVRLLYVDQERPLSYYFDDNLQLFAKSTEVFGHEYILFYEQVISKNYKAAVELLTSQKVKDRPANYGINLKQGYAFTSRLFSQLKLSYKAEDRGQRLHDDRGFFSAYGGEAILTAEPIYDLLISASYALNVEREKNSVSGMTTQVGSDQFGLGAQYALNRSITLEFMGSYAVTNTDLTDYSVRGGFIWAQ